MRKKILYIITKSDIGGAQKYVNDLAKNLNNNLFETKILYGGKEIKWLSNKILPHFLFLNDWLTIAELVKIYKKEHPAIIHLNSSKAGFIGSIAAKIYEVACCASHVARPKVIFTAHGWIFNPTNALSLPARQFYILLHKIAALFQDKIICVSEYDYRLALQYKIAPEKKLSMIHNGIDINIKFLSREIAKGEILKKLSTFNFQLSTNVPWIGSIGRLVKEKNYETFIKTATLIPNAVFFIIGNGPELSSLQQTTDSLRLSKRFFFIEPDGEDFKYLKAFDAFVMSSIKEGLPYILLEAMVAKLPIIVTEAGGIPEIIKNHESGLMVSQKNPEMLAKAIQGILVNKNIANELKTTAEKIVREKFGIKQMLVKTNNLYENTIADS